jgi:hypothetical protein
VSGEPLTNMAVVLIYIFYEINVSQIAQYSDSIRTGLQGFDPRPRQRILPLTSVSRPALVPTQPPVQWVQRIFPGVNSAGAFC